MYAVIEKFCELSAYVMVEAKGGKHETLRWCYPYVRYYFKSFLWIFKKRIF